MAKPEPPASGGGATPEQLFAELRAGGSTPPRGADAAPAAPDAPSMDGDTVLELTGDVAGRPVADKYLLVPLKAGPGGREALYTCNDVGRACWQAIDGERSLGDIAAEIARDFDGASPSQVVADVIAFAGDLLSVGAARARRAA